MNLCIEMNMRKSAYVMSGYFFCPADFSLHMNLFIEMNIRKKLNEFKTVDGIKCIYDGQADISFLQWIFLSFSGFFFPSVNFSLHMNLFIEMNIRKS